SIPFSVYMRLFRYFVLGLSLFLMDTALDLTVSSKYFDMRDCFKTLSHVFPILDPSELLQGNETEDSPIPGFLKSGFYMQLREETIQSLPLHWARRVNDIVRFQIVDITPISESCTFNGEQFDNFVDLGLDLCEGPLKGDNRTSLIRSFWTDNVLDEDQLLHVFLPGSTHGNESLFSQLAATATAQGLNLSRALISIDKVNKLLTEEEVALIQEFLLDWGPHIPPMINGLSTKLNVSDIEKVRVQSKRSGRELPRDKDSLAQLNVSLTEFITDPLLLFKFLSDKEKAAILTRIQRLLPEFVPSEVNSILKIKKALDATPGVNDLLSDAFLRFPIEFFIKILGAGFSAEDEVGFKEAYFFFQKEETRLRGLFDMMLERDLLTHEGRSHFLSSCSKTNYSVHCINRKTDLCPNGHISYGVLTLAAMAVPGILFGLSEFFHFKHFRFGELKVMGREWSLVLKLMILPLYVFVMIPFFFFISIWK
ncbi:Uncharacterized protein FKW44_012351, partial [Caligus rogercresseyi]